MALLVEQRGSGHDLAGRTDAALQPAVRDEGTLQRGQIVCSETLDRRDGGAVDARREDETGRNKATVDEDAAGAADAHPAAILRAGQLEVLTEEPEQRPVCSYGHAD